MSAIKKPVSAVDRTFLEDSDAPTTAAAAPARSSRDAVRQWTAPKHLGPSTVTGPPLRPSLDLMRECITDAIKEWSSVPGMGRVVRSVEKREGAVAHELKVFSIRAPIRGHKPVEVHINQITRTVVGHDAPTTYHWAAFLRLVCGTRDHKLRSACRAYDLCSSCMKACPQHC